MDVHVDDKIVQAVSSYAHQPFLKLKCASLLVQFRGLMRGMGKLELVEVLRMTAMGLGSGEVSSLNEEGLCYGATELFLPGIKQSSIISSCFFRLFKKVLK